MTSWHLQQWFVLQLHVRIQVERHLHYSFSDFQCQQDRKTGSIMILPFTSCVRPHHQAPDQGALFNLLALTNAQLCVLKADQSYCLHRSWKQQQLTPEAVQCPH